MPSGRLLSQLVAAVLSHICAARNPQLCTFSIRLGNNRASRTAECRSSGPIEVMTLCSILAVVCVNTETFGTFQHGNHLHGRKPRPSAAGHLRRTPGDLLSHLVGLLHFAFQAHRRHLAHHLPARLRHLQLGLLEHLPQPRGGLEAQAARHRQPIVNQRLVAYICTSLISMRCIRRRQLVVPFPFRPSHFTVISVYNYYFKLLQLLLLLLQLASHLAHHRLSRSGARAHSLVQGEENEN